MKRTLSLFLLLPLSAGEPLSLSQALRLAGRTSVVADRVKTEQQSAAEETRQIQSAFFPEVHLVGGYKAQNHRPELLSPPMSLGPLHLGSLTLPAFTVPSQSFPIEDKQGWRAKASLQYLVWDFGKRDAALEASRKRETAISLGGGGDLRRQQGEVAGRYMAILNLKAQEQVLVQRRAALLAHRASVQALFDHGVIARNDLLRTDVALRAVEDAQCNLQQNLRSALEALNVALGRPASEPLELPANLGLPPALNLSEAACRTQAAESHDGVRALQARLAALADQTNFRRRDSRPNVVAELSHTYAQNPYMKHEQDTALFVGLSWKLFDGGARSAKVRASELEAARAQRDLLEAQRLAGAGAVAHLRAFRQALQEMETARINVASAEENLRIVSDQFNEGLVRTMEVLDAEAVLAESRSSLAERRYRAFAQQAALLVMLGQDLPTFYDTLSPEK